MNDREMEALQQSMVQIYELGARFGLDPYPIHWEVVPASIMYEFGAYGLPGRFSHWTHGKAYASMKTMYDYGLSKIYELVVNTDPCYAFLLDTNQPIQNKLVVAHVLGHSDFFKHNVYFAHTNRKMLETVSVHAERIRRYEFQHGAADVETFLDAVLSIRDNVDPLAHRRKEPLAAGHEQRVVGCQTAYDDLWALDRRHQPTPLATQPPAVEEDDLLLFLIHHARSLEDWQRDVVAIVREEMLYFLPQMQTKIMNEGWASLWHARILRAMELPTDEHVQFAQLHSSVLSPSRHQLNPYYLGYQMWEHIERLANDGQPWTPAMVDSPGTRKIFELREVESDVSFIRNHLDQELVDTCDLYGYRFDGNSWTIHERACEPIRQMLVSKLAHLGHPRIVAVDADHGGNGGLLLRHCWDGQDLDLEYSRKTLEYIQRLWGRRVHLRTIIDGRETTLSYDPASGHGRSERS